MALSATFNFLSWWLSVKPRKVHFHGRLVPELGEWIRRRVRMCYWKQWRWARAKIRNMLNLGVALRAAIQHGVSSLSYWRMARTPVTQQALSNAWLKAQGLLSVKDLWCKAQGYSA
jgi:RNA-directed DNA polymerase